MNSIPSINPDRGSRKWGIREITELHKRRLKGERTLNLAEEVGVTPSALRQAWRAWGFSIPSAIPELEVLTRIAERHTEGEALADLAEELDLEYGQLHSALMRNKLITRQLKHWPDEVLDQVREAYEGGEPARSIASRLEIGRCMVYHLLRRTDTEVSGPYTRWTPRRVEKLRTMLEDGATVDDCAEHFGVSPAAISMLCSRKGIRKGGYRKWTPSNLRMAQRRLRNGETWRQVAKSMDIQSTSLKRALKRHGYMP